MKKIIALIASAFLFTGLKAQKDTIIKKETTPAAKQSGTVSSKNIPGGISKDALLSKGIITDTTKLSKGIIIPVTTKPSKAIIIPDTDKPVKGNPMEKPSKF